MQTLEAIRKKIATAEDLRSVVRVMKALAAVSIRQYERAVVSLAEYARTVETGLQALLRARPAPPILSLARGGAAPGRRLAAVVFGSDQGMCGSFNEQVTRFALAQIEAAAPAPEDRVVLALGARAAVRLEDAGQPVERRFDVPGSVLAITQAVNGLLVEVERLRSRRGADRVLLFYNRPVGGAAFRPQVLQLWPVDPGWLAALRARKWASRSLPSFPRAGDAGWGGWGRLFSALIREHLFVSLYRPLAESLAAENASRLASMQAAETNIEEHLAGLTARYHRQRQQSITEELLDILSGFETLAAEKGQPRVPIG